MQSLVSFEEDFGFYEHQEVEKKIVFENERELIITYLLKG